MNSITRIDIETELAAAARGECLACRIGARHATDSTCPGATEIADRWCARGRHDVPKQITRGGRIVKSGPCTHCNAAF